jgi:branched-chain amino acid transport system ATP-binding protein
MLEAERLQAAYGDATALWDVSLTVGEGELVSVVGPNGSGKTTLINVIAGLLPVRGGRLRFLGEDLARLAPHQVCGRGIALVPEGRRLFTGMTVEENLEIGCYVPAARAERGVRLERVYALFPVLRARRRQLAGTLSGGQQQMVAIGRALMARPRLMLLDEPSMGLAPMLVKEIFDIVGRLNREEGVAVLLAEQNATMALQVAQHGYVMENGRIVLDGDAKTISQNEDIKEFYLGLTGVGQRKSYRDVKHYRRRKRWLS